jgi:hypothetical protein
MCAVFPNLFSFVLNLIERKKSIFHSYTCAATKFPEQVFGAKWPSTINNSKVP